MKSTLILFTLLFSSISFAAVRINCKTVEAVATNSQRVTFTQVGDRDVMELGRYDFVLEIYKPGSRATVLKEIVKLTFEDVMVSVTNRSKGIDIKIYMDEPTDSWMKIGSLKKDIICKNVNL